MSRKNHVRVDGKLLQTWISGEEFLKKPLGAGMLQVWELMHADCAGECLQTLMPDGTIVSKIQ